MTVQQAIGSYQPDPTVEQLDQDLRGLSDSLLARYAEALDPSQMQTKSWALLPIEQRRAMRAGNEVSRRQNEAQREAAKAADDARIRARMDAAHQARIDAYQAQVRGAWIGDDTSFDAAWPRILEDFRIDQARSAIDANTMRLRAKLLDF